MHENFYEEMASKNPLFRKLTTSSEDKSGERRKKPNKKEPSKDKNRLKPLSNDEYIVMVLDTLKFISEDENNKNLYVCLKEFIASSGAKKHMTY